MMEQMMEQMMDVGGLVERGGKTRHALRWDSWLIQQQRQRGQQRVDAL